MGIATSLAEKIWGHNCERLVQYTKQEVTFKGLSGEGAGYKISLGNFSNSVKVTNRVTEVMKALDNNQFLLCQQAHDSIASPELRDKCLKARVMCTIGLSNFQALAALQEPGKPLNIEIRKWIKNMNALVLQCMESFLPEPNKTTYHSVSKAPMYRLRKSREIDREIILMEDSLPEMAGKKVEDEKITRIEAIPLQPSKQVSKKLTMSQIMKYQGIDEADMNKAVKILKQPSQG